jgi:endonuclease/exonuclease/phosphatase family metal-dependent hydrolase
VVGLQELQPNQVGPLAQTAGGLQVFPGTSGPERRDSENSIAWNPDRWQLVSSRLVKIPYFGGRPRNMPLVRLRHKTTGAQVFFLNVHNPANTSRFGDNARWRAQAVDLEVRLVKQLRARTKLPVVVTGDMNDRATYFCSFAPRSGMRASNGGTVAAGQCTPPEGAGIDWILASRDVSFLDHLTYRGRPVTQTSDHPLVLSRLRVDARRAGAHRR